jgi:phosphoribosyl-ATP pyrophosphohydrolase
MQRFFDILEQLGETIESRRGADPESSWTARLLADPGLCAKKVGEEAVETALVETALAAVQHDPERLAKESADLIYHWLVLLAATGVPLAAVAAELEARQAKSGIEEKRARLSE